MGKSSKHRRHRSSSLESDEQFRRKKKSKRRHRDYSTDDDATSHYDRHSSKHSRHSKSKEAKRRKYSGDRHATMSFIEKHHLEKYRSNEDEKLDKAAMKALETPEEKLARRLRKKRLKELQRQQQSGIDNGYTNRDNPFGDESLSEAFVWKKKLTSGVHSGADVSNASSVYKQKQTSTMIELEKVKRRRLEREHEMQVREQENELKRREKEAENFKNWVAQEDEFHLQQAKLRSSIRITDGRAKPIDMLAHYISVDEITAVDMIEPTSYIEGLKLQDLEDLIEDINVYMKLEQGRNANYWCDVTILARAQRVKLSSAEEDCGRGGINAAVMGEVQQEFKGKSLVQLLSLKEQIEKKLASDSSIDTSYWECLLKDLEVYCARVRLKEMHQSNLRQKFFQMKQEQGVTTSTTLFPSAKPDDEACSSALPEEERYEEIYDASRFSPDLLSAADLPADTVYVDPEAEYKKLEFAREKFLGTGEADVDADAQLLRKAKEGMDEDECEFRDEEKVEKNYLWSDKYRPRKPQYFNRVHTGYEWNKYNQTHYDPENPPPKIVQGYKFNIFYPDLIDKSKPPTYHLFSSPDDEFAVIRIMAGPPYEDIAFKIVNREWEYGHRHGYRCQFLNNVFQLWFKFKVFRYRR